MSKWLLVQLLTFVAGFIIVPTVFVGIFGNSASQRILKNSANSLLEFTSSQKFDFSDDQQSVELPIEPAQQQQVSQLQGIHEFADQTKDNCLDRQEIANLLRLVMSDVRDDPVGHGGNKRADSEKLLGLGYNPDLAPSYHERLSFYDEAGLLGQTNEPVYSCFYGKTAPIVTIPPTAPPIGDIPSTAPCCKPLCPDYTAGISYILLTVSTPAALPDAVCVPEIANMSPRSRVRVRNRGVGYVLCAVAASSQVFIHFEIDGLNTDVPLATCVPVDLAAGFRGKFVPCNDIDIAPRITCTAPYPHPQSESPQCQACNIRIVRTRVIGEDSCEKLDTACGQCCNAFGVQLPLDEIPPLTHNCKPSGGHGVFNHFCICTMAQG